MARIVELGNAQLRERGAAELSVREIARGLGVVSSAIYRYVASRDELLTLLIVDAFEDLAGTVENAVEQAAGEGEGSPRARCIALGDAMSAWAIEHPERWTLLYGTPVRGYSAPAERTNDAGTRVIRAVLAIAEDAQEQGVPQGSVTPRGAAADDLAPEVAALLEEHLTEFDIELPAGAAALALTVWSGLVGVISAQVFGQLGPDAVAVGEHLLAAQVRMLADLITPR